MEGFGVVGQVQFRPNGTAHMVLKPAAEPAQPRADIAQAPPTPAEVMQMIARGDILLHTSRKDTTKSELRVHISNVQSYRALGRVATTPPGVTTPPTHVQNVHQNRKKLSPRPCSLPESSLVIPKVIEGCRWEVCRRAIRGSLDKSNTCQQGYIVATSTVLTHSLISVAIGAVNRFVVLAPSLEAHALKRETLSPPSLV